MFEQPAKKDIDYALSMLMHEARRQVADKKNEITSDAIKHGALRGNRVIITVADAADKVHLASIIQVKQILLDFIKRMDKSATEITAWARPHLQNLSDTLLAGIPPNGFANDHQRVIAQYQAVFNQRVEGTLREVEIGYVRGAGFSGGIAMSEQEEWISASGAVALLDIGDDERAQRTICQRAYAGLIKARAERFIRDEHLADNVEIPGEFWWAKGERALTQNWNTGDFETWIDHRIHLEAFGVTFRRADVERIKPGTAIAESIAADPPTGQGRPIAVPPMSIERRRHLLAATSILKAYGHTGFDRMLLELGAPEDVGTGSGLAARANSLARYILSNPDAKAFDGSLIGDAIIKRARSLVDRGMDASSNLTSHERSEYNDAAANDVVEEGQNPPPGRVVSGSTTLISGDSDQLISEISAVSVARKKPRRKVFIVHGHDTGPREAVARFLERLDFEPIILHERANRGRTIITKFQEEAADVGFAVVLMTPDDTGGKYGVASDELQARARQNVIFELGFFIGVLGPERVAALIRGHVERPSDFDGVVYIGMNDNEAWKQLLARELQAAGFEVDFNKIFA
jgi:predicted nucleotide-binding protein